MQSKEFMKKGEFSNKSSYIIEEISTYQKPWSQYFRSSKPKKEYKIGRDENRKKDQLVMMEYGQIQNALKINIK